MRNVIRQNDHPLPEKVMALPIYVGTPFDQNGILKTLTGFFKMLFLPAGTPNTPYGNIRHTTHAAAAPMVVRHYPPSYLKQYIYVRTTVFVVVTNWTFGWTSSFALIGPFLHGNEAKILKKTAPPHQPGRGAGGGRWGIVSLTSVFSPTTGLALLLHLAFDRFAIVSTLVFLFDPFCSVRSVDCSQHMSGSRYREVQDR